MKKNKLFATVLSFGFVFCGVWANAQLPPQPFQPPHHVPPPPIFHPPPPPPPPIYYPPHPPPPPIYNPPPPPPIYYPPQQGNGYLQIGQQAYNVARDSALVTVIGIEQNGTYVIQFDDGALAGQTGNNWSASDLAVLFGCGNGGQCVGQTAYNVSRDSAQVQIIGVQSDGRYVISFEDGANAGGRGGNWDDSDLARNQGCGPSFCVGEQAINISRNNARVEIVGIESNGTYVIYFEDGANAGGRGGNWSDSDLARTY